MFFIRYKIITVIFTLICLHQKISSQSLYNEAVQDLESNNAFLNASAHQNLAQFFLRKNIDSVVYHIKKASSFIPEDSLALRSNNFKLWASFFLQKSQLDSAKIYFKNAITIDSILEHPLEMARGYNGLSVIAVNKSDYVGGIKNALKTLQLVERNGSVMENSIVEYNLAMLHVHIRNYKRAKYHHKNALEKAIILKDSFLTSTIYGALTRIYVREKKLDSASYYLSKVKAYNNGNENKGKNYHHFAGEIYYEKRQYAEAITSFKKALEVSKNKEDIAFSQKMMAATYLKLNQPYKSLEVLNKIDSLIGNLKMPFLRQGRDSLYAATYKVLHQFKKATYYRDRYQKSWDSTFALQKINTINEIENAYYNRKQKRVLLKQEGVLETYLYQNKVLIIFIAFIIIASGYFLILAYRRRQILQQEKIFADQQYMVLSDTNMQLKNKLLAISEKLEIKRSNIKGVKYLSSSLSLEHRQSIMNKLLNYMDQEQPYLDSELSHKKLAKQLSLPTHHLSEVLNSNLGKNFYSFINLYRVEAAKEILINDRENLTMLAVAFDSGFNSKASFNRIFKEITGKTPSSFRKAVA